MTIGKVHLTEAYARFRLAQPGRFKPKSFRIQKLGKGIERVAGKLKSTGKWQTQSVLIPKPLYEKGMRVKGLPKGKFKITK